MLFETSEQQGMLEQALERFIRERYDLVARKTYLAEADGFSDSNWQFLADLGLLGLPFDEADGGFGGTLADVSSVMRQLGKGLVVEPYFYSIVLAGRLLAASSDTAFKELWLSPLLAGEKKIALAHLERTLTADGSNDGCLPNTRLSAGEGALTLGGSKCLVAAPWAMDLLLVTAINDDGRLVVCAVDPSAEGISYRRYQTVDGLHLADVSFSAIPIEPQQVLSFESPENALNDVLTYARAALCGEAVGVMDALIDMTVEHVKTRKQFGQPIGRFQVLKHRLVDAKTLLLQADCLALLAADNDAKDWVANVAAASAFIFESALHVGHEAIQMHGGMGLTDELAVSHYHKRLVLISRLLGSVDTSREQFVAEIKWTDHDRRSSAIDFQCFLDAKQSEHHREVTQFFKQELDDATAIAVRRQSISWPEKNVADAWQARLNARGWLAPLWPVDCGGPGWTPVERFVFEYESGWHGAPEQIPMGFRYVGPVIAEFGTDWQKSFFLPKLLSSEHHWAQGFSEPGAGSDLSAVSTTAVPDGDDYIVNGSKMWTTNAHCADWLFALVRTEKGERPQQGITFLLIDMKSPGVRVEPIPLLAVDHEVNQVFLDNVRVPKKNRVGEEGLGWDYAKYLLELERGGTVFSGRTRSELNHLSELVSTINPRLWSDKLFMHKLAKLEERLMALELYEFRTAQSLMSADSIGVAGPIIKLLSSELQKDIQELAVDVAGHLALELSPVRPLSDLDASQIPGCDLELVVTPRYLNMRVSSIYGGSSEVQREIISKQLLGLR
jgi:alkylation response protein AidB-like acyl-CoA dehydrogenase